MNTAATHGPIRLMFELARDDNPRLFDDLIRFNKGPKRVNRLRFLAHEGLMAQQWLASAITLVPTGGAAPGPAVNPSVAWQTNQAFDAPTDEGEA